LGIRDKGGKKGVSTTFEKKTLMYCSSALVTGKVELKLNIDEEIPLWDINFSRWDGSALSGSTFDCS